LNIFYVYIFRKNNFLAAYALGLVAVLLFVLYVVINNLGELANGSKSGRHSFLFRRLFIPFWIGNEDASEIIIYLKAKLVVCNGIGYQFKFFQQIFSVYPCLVFRQQIFRGQNNEIALIFRQVKSSFFPCFGFVIKAGSRHTKFAAQTFINMTVGKRLGIFQQKLLD
jgi:hypothetical protein